MRELRRLIEALRAGVSNANRARPYILVEFYEKVGEGERAYTVLDDHLGEAIQRVVADYGDTERKGCVAVFGSGIALSVSAQ
jgi:hypothetical protein